MQSSKFKEYICIQYTDSENPLGKCQVRNSGASVFLGCPFMDMFRYGWEYGHEHG
jgi:hypothetical protein